MKIGIIGSGNIGGAAGTLWANASHEIVFSSRHPEDLAPLVAQAGSRAHAGTPEEAAAWGEVVLVAIPFGRYDTLPAAQLTGKIVSMRRITTRSATAKLPCTAARQAS